MILTEKDDEQEDEQSTGFCEQLALGASSIAEFIYKNSYIFTNVVMMVSLYIDFFIITQCANILVLLFLKSSIFYLVPHRSMIDQKCQLPKVCAWNYLQHAKNRMSICCLSS